MASKAMSKHSGYCSCPHHKMGAVLVVLFGLTFLLGQLEVISQHMVGLTWPVIVILFGLKGLMRGMCSCCEK